MKKFHLLLFAIFFLTILVFTGNIKAQNSECSNPKDLNLDAIGRCLAEIQKAYELSVKATKPLESQLNSMQTQINGIKQRVKAIENDIFVKKENINQGYKNLEKQQEILYATIRNFYIKSYYNSPILAFLSATSASEITKALAYQKAATDQDKVIITNVVISITDLETKKKNLENEQVRLAAIKKDLDEESAKIEKIVSGARSYQSVLSGQIAALSQKQQEILGERLAGLNIYEAQQEREIANVWTHLLRKSCSKRMQYLGASRELRMRKLRHSFRDAHDAYDVVDLNTLLDWEAEHLALPFKEKV